MLNIVILFLLILISGVLSSSEIALSSSNRGKVKMLADNSDKKAAQLLAAIDDPHHFFATTQLYITFIAFFSGAYAANSFTSPFVNWIQKTGLPVPMNVTEPLAFILITVILTYFALIFGELAPKRIAMQYSIRFALRTLPFLKALSVLALPVVKILSASAKLVLKLVRVQDDSPEAYATKEDIRMLVESGGEQGHIAQSEQGMIENIINIDKLTAGDICTHRLDVVALPLEADINTVLDMLADEFYTRLPVYENNLDNIRGVLYTKDVLRYMATNRDLSGFDIGSMIRDVRFVSLSKKIDELFQEMRRDRIFLVVVVDEHGGTMGIVTMEDLIERIVGSIQDEYDVDEPPEIINVNYNTFRILGTVSLATIQEYLDVPLPVDEYETLSGFLVGQLGHIPSEGDKPEVVGEGLIFKVENVSDKRIAVVTAIKNIDDSVS